VSEEKANQRVEEFKREMKTLSIKLKEAEQRAEHAEKQVKRLQKEVDRLEGIYIYQLNIILTSNRPNQFSNEMTEPLLIRYINIALIYNINDFVPLLNTHTEKYITTPTHNLTPKKEMSIEWTENLFKLQSACVYLRVCVCVC